MMETMTKLAEIDGEYQIKTDANQPEFGAPRTLETAPPTAQPRGVRLDNDGMFHYWIKRGQTWTLTHDGVGWRARCEDHPYSMAHVMRLADADESMGAFMTSLPVAGGGPVELEPGTTYQLRLGSNQDVTGPALILSMVT